MSHWANRFVGTPYSEDGHDETGCHCWGLVVLVYARVLNINLPTYGGRLTSIEEQTEIATLLDEERAASTWHPCAQEREFDVAVFRRGRLETHVGIVIGGGRMLHVTAADQAKVETYQSGAWKHRLTGFYRHRELFGTQSI